jgi:phospho-N-acetylmuramoyl-pentapeptide-transferase
MVGFSNAVNLTDGLDGLAAGVTAIAALGLAGVSLQGGHPGAATVSAAMGGACLGFLAFNRHPARVFMGDTGSMALGGAVAAVAAVARSELLLLVLGGVYVAEAASVMIQVASFQLTGRRVFLMSPLHHHFELKGWPETRVVKAFWAAALGCVLLALAAAGMKQGW